MLMLELEPTFLMTLLSLLLLTKTQESQMMTQNQHHLLTQILEFLMTLTQELNLIQWSQISQNQLQPQLLITTQEFLTKIPGQLQPRLLALIQESQMKIQDQLQHLLLITIQGSLMPTTR